MKTTGQTAKTLRSQSSGLGKKFVILWVLASFLVSNTPAYASREDRLDQIRADRQERREERLQLRAERMAERICLPSLNSTVPQINLAPIFQNTQISNRLNTLEQRRMERANLVTSRREARATALQDKLSAVTQISNKTVQALDSGRSRNINAGLKLDLSSAASNIVLGQKLFSGNGDTVTITVGGEEKTYTAGSKVTAAEYASILQTLNGGQTLTLDSKGTALGGKLDFETITSNGDNLKLSSLVIPEQVLAVGNFSKTSEVKLKGDLVNYGSVYALSNREGGTKATIATTNLHNQEGGLISSVPNSSLGTDLAPSLDLKLHADDTLSNSGKIESSGDLTLSAGNQVINGDSRGRSTLAASAVAANNLIIDAPVVSNNGLLAARNGSVNFSASADATHDGSITLNNTNGTVQALNGDINFRDASASTTEKFSTTVNGGDLLSQKLNVYGGDGAVNVHSNNITGGVTVKSGTAFVSAATSDLDIDELVTTGDPVTASGGNVNVGSITTNGNPYTVIAGGDIVFDPNAVVDTSNGAGAGGNVILAAGAAYTAGGGVYQITGGTASGGGIYGNNNAQIITNGSTSAGSVQLVSFTGSNTGSGNIYMPTETITANSGTGDNSTVIAIGRFIEIAGITNTGGTAGTGGVILNSFGATVSGGNVVIDGTTGAQIGTGAFAPATSTATPGYVLTGPINSSGAVSLASSSDLVIRGAINARGFTGTAKNDLGFENATASITSPDGITLVSGHNIYMVTSATNLFFNANSATAGNITIVGGAAFTENAGTVTVTGASGTGGFIDFNFTDITGLSANSSAGAGGNINIATYGQVSINSTTGITASGSGANANGNITIVGADGPGLYSVFVENNITNNGGLGGGNFTASSSTPTGVTINKANGSLTAGNFLGGTAAAGDVNIRDVTVRGAITATAGGLVTTSDLSGSTITLTAGGNLQTDTLTSTGPISATSGGNIQTGLINSGGAVTVTTTNTGGFVDLGNVTATGNALNITSEGDVTLETTSVGSLSVAARGFLVLQGNLAAPGGITLIASRSIYTDVNNLVISSAANTTGGNIVIAAGALWTSTASTISVTGAGSGSTGGSIDFAFRPLDTLTSQGLSANSTGGSITLISFDGNISTNAATDILTGGLGSGNNGDVTMISNATGTAINIAGPINTAGSNNAGGAVSLTTATANVSTPVVIQRSSATVSSGNFSVANPTLTNGGIIVSAPITTRNAGISIQAGSNASISGALNSQSARISVRSGGFLNVGAINAGTGAIALTSTESINLNGNLTAQGGILGVSGHDIFANATGLTISTANSNDGSDITLIAGAAFSQTDASVTVSGASTTGGQINFDSNNLNTITSRNTSGGGSGGDVTLVAFGGSDDTGRVLMDATNGSIQTNANSGSTNGNVVVVAGATSGTGILLGNVTTSNGSGNVNTGDVNLRTAAPNTAVPVVISKNNASVTSGNFNGGTATDASINFNTVAVASDADVTLTGGDITGTGFTGGPNSVLTVNSTGNVNITNAITLGTANITSTDSVNVSLNQGAAGAASIIGSTVNLGNSTTGTLRIAGGFVDLNSVNAANTAITSTGDIALNANITSPGGILLVAGQNIFADVAGIDISSASASTNGGAISIIAGAAFTQDANTVTVTGASATGGNVDFDFNNVGTITSRSTAANGSGGAINLIAFDGANDFTFVFTDATTQILSGGTGTGNNGDVTVIGGGSANNVVFVGTVNTTGGNATTGNVFMASGAPTTTPAVVLQKSSAAVSSGNFANNVVLNPANVIAGNITVSSDADVTLRAGALVDVGAVNGGANSALTINAGTTTDLLSSTMGTINITSGSDVTIAGAINQGAAGSLTITSGGLTQVLGLTTGSARIQSVGDLFIGGPVTAQNSFVATSQGFIDLDNGITARGGILLVAGRTIAANTPNVVGLSSSTSGGAGDITLIAGAAFTQNGTSVTITGGSALGGLLDLGGANVNSIDSRSTGGNGAGGDVTLIAFSGSDPGTGQIYTAAETVINTGGNGSGANGTFTAIGNNNSTGFFGAAIAGPLTTSGGAANTGDVYIAAAQITVPVSITKSNASVTGDFKGGAVTNGFVFTGDITVANGADVTLRAGGDVDTDVVNGGANSILTITAGGAMTIESSNFGTVNITAGDFVTAGNFNQGAGGLLNITAGGDLQVEQIVSNNVRLSAGGDLFLLDTINTTSGSFVGTAQGGVNIYNDITAPGGILLVAGRDILSAVDGVIDLDTKAVNAGDITLIAGAAFTSDATNVTITGASTTGGGIDFDFNRVNSIDTRSNGVNGAGGDLTMIGFAGNVSGSGFVFTDTAGSIRTGGSGTGTNGNVTVVAGNNTGSAVGLRGLVDTTGGASGTGNVFTAAATPDTTPAVVIAKNNASITAGDFTTGPLAGGSSYIDNVIVGTGANITMVGGGFASITDLTGGANSSIFASFNEAIDTRNVLVGAGGNVSLLTNLFIRLNGDVTAPGGVLMVAGTDIFNTIAGDFISTNSTTGNAGDLTLIAGAAFTQNASSVIITGASATGGRIDFDANALASLTANSGGGNGAGGDITLVSLFGSNNTGEVFTDAAMALNAGGSGTGSNGTITIVGAKNNGASGIFLNNNINLSGGAQGTGAITLATSNLPGAVTLAKSTGSITAGTFLGGTLANSSINGLDLTVRGGAINIRSGNAVSFNALNVSGNVNGNGGSIDVSTAATAALDLGGTFGNKIGSLNAAGGSTSGNGGSISATATGTGGINISAPLNVAATEGNGGSVTLTATNGDLNFASGTATINASAGTTSATARNGGSISLTGRNITGSNPFQLLANGVSGGNGGQIAVVLSTGDINVGTGNGQFTASASGPGGVIALSATGAGGDVNVLATGPLSASTVNLSSSQGVLLLNGNVTGTTAVNLTVGGANTITGAGTVSGGNLTITAGTGATTLTTNVASLTLATNGNVTITENDDITLNAGTTGAGSLNLNATGDDITVGGNVTANGGITLTTTGAGTMGGAGRLISNGVLSLNGGTGAINLNTDVATLAVATSGSLTVDELNNITLNAIAAASVDITAGNGIAHGTGVIASGDVSLTANGGDIGASGNAILINNGGNPVDLEASATGDIYITIQGTGVLNLGPTTGDDITLNAGGPIVTTGDITALGTLDITTNSLTYPNALTANIINVQSQAGSGLTLDGGTGGTMTAPGGINLTATFGNLTLSGKQDWFGPTTLTAVNAPGSQIIISNGADIEGHDSVTVISNGITNQGGGFDGDPIIIQNDYFTYANSVGDVNLGSNLVFHGQNLAVIAAGNVNITGGLTLLDLSDTGDAGSLFIVAGYNFTPGTGGQIISPVQFTLGTQSTSGGNINLATATIDLSSINGNGGKLTAIAAAGATNAGTIALGNINTTSTNGVGGNVLAIGEGGVTTGNINTIGGSGTGTIELAVADPTITGGAITVTDGTAAGGSFQAGALSAGNMVFGNLNGSTITLRGASGAGNTIAQTAATSINATVLNINSSAGSVNLTSTNVPTLNVNGAGSVIVNNTAQITLGTLTGASLNLSVSSTGVITVPTAVSGIGGLTLSGTAGAGLDAIVLGGNVSTATTISLTATGGADLNLANRTLSSSNVTLASTAGDVNVANTGLINATGTAIIDAFDSFSVAGTITAGSVALTSGDSILTGDITGTITAPNGTFLTSTNGSIGVDANNRFITNSTSLLLRAGGGGVFVQNLSTAGVNVTDVSASTTVDLIVGGPVILHDVVAGNGDIKVVQSGVGSLTVAANANLSTTEGDIILQNLDLNKKTGKIIIDDGATIKASGTTAGVGEVFIAMGPLPIPPYTDRKKPPKGVTITETGGAGVFLGKKGIDTKKETNIALNALSRDLVFSLSGKLNRKAIHVGSNVTITADPPGDVVPKLAGMSARSTSTATNSAAPTSTSSFALADNSLNSGSLDTLSNAGSGLTSTALQTDLSATPSGVLLAEKSMTVSGDALSAIFGEETDSIGSIYVDAALVSDALPNAVVPHATLAHNLSNGSAVFAPVRNMTVKTSHADISVAAGSVVLVVAAANGTSVYDLHDAKKDAVQVAFHNQKLALSPGRHMTVSATEKRSYADANLAESIFHRGVVSAKTARGGSLFTSEFAVNSAIDCVPALTKLMSSNHPECAKVAAKLTKTQAVILYVSQSAEEFQQHLKAQVTAMR